MSDPNKIFGYEIRKPYKSEDDFFNKNTNISGMAAEDNRITLNPYSNLTPEQKRKVLMNEAARLYMIENNVGNAPVTKEQKEYFQGTKYGIPENEKQLKRTILARILSGDSSAGESTRQQQIESFDIYNQLLKR